jgi:hypothetical protein
MQSDQPAPLSDEEISQKQMNIQNNDKIFILIPLMEIQLLLSLFVTCYSGIAITRCSLSSL